MGTFSLFSVFKELNAFYMQDIFSIFLRNVGDGKGKNNCLQYRRYSLDDAFKEIFASYYLKMVS